MCTAPTCFSTETLSRNVHNSGTFLSRKVHVILCTTSLNVLDVIDCYHTATSQLRFYLVHTESHDFLLRVENQYY